MSTIWYEGNRLSDAEGQAFSRRSHLYGDGLFETMRVHRGKICFWESHYFRLMASMRILRMEIPEAWSPDELEAELISCLPSGSWDCRLRLSVWRSGGLGYAPSTNGVEHAIYVQEIESLGYPHPPKTLKVDVFQEHKKAPGLLSSLKSSQSALYILAAQFAVEQSLDDVILLGLDNRILETSRGNLFVLKGIELTTAPLSAGALRGVIREQVLRLAPGLGLEVKEEALSPFALLDADEIWMSNAIDGISTVTNYRKSIYSALHAGRMQNALRASALF
ncbi:MAG: aminotransferase class IV [Schleiferiaceae bacterium]|nr:aminotransferase class IV [Schleiferiaceae bacterium]